MFKDRKKLSEATHKPILEIMHVGCSLVIKKTFYGIDAVLALRGTSIWEQEKTRKWQV